MPASPRGVALVAALVATASVLPRLFVTELPDWARAFVWSDVIQSWRDSTMAGHRVPFLDVPFAYPPVVGYLGGAFSLAAPDLRWYVAAWGATVVAAAALTGWLLARATDPRTALRVWACTPQLLLLAGINFDVVACLFLTLGLVAVRRQRPMNALAAFAAGAATKLFPAVMAPPLVLRRWLAGDRRGAVRAAAVFGAVLAALYLPALAAPHGTAPFVSAYAVGVRPNPDSPWGFAQAVLTSAGMDDAGRILTAITLVGLVATYAFGVLPRSGARDPLHAPALGLVALMLWTRLYSPQYSLWLLPLLAFTGAGSAYAMLTAGDLIVFATIFPITLGGGAVPLEVFVPLLALGVTLRHVALLRLWLTLRAG